MRLRASVCGADTDVCNDMGRTFFGFRTFQASKFWKRIKFVTVLTEIFLVHTILGNLKCFMSSCISVNPIMAINKTFLKNDLLFL